MGQFDFQQSSSPLLAAITQAPAQRQELEIKAQQARQQRLNSLLDNMTQFASLARSVQQYKAGQLEQQKAEGQLQAQNQFQGLFANQNLPQRATPLAPSLGPDVQGPLPQSETASMDQTLGQNPAYQNRMQGTFLRGYPQAADKIAENLYPKPTPKTSSAPKLDQLLADRVSRGEITIEDAYKLKQTQTPESYIQSGVDASGNPIFYGAKSLTPRVAPAPGGGPVYPKTEPVKIKEEVDSIDEQLGQVTELERMLKKVPAGGAGAFASIGSKATGGLVAPDVKIYNDLIPSIAVKIYRAMTGDTRLSDSDAQARAYPLLPKPSDAPKVRLDKLKNIRTLLKQRKSVVTGSGIQSSTAQDDPLGLR